jgi:hypothetical protein
MFSESIWDTQNNETHSVEMDYVYIVKLDVEFIYHYGETKILNEQIEPFPRHFIIT